MEIKIDSVEDYKLYIKREIKKRTLDDTKARAIEEMLLEVFYDGMKFAQNKLKVKA